MNGLTLYDGQDTAVRLGRELGRGGEGAVFDIDGNPADVAKVYHEVPTAKKAEKLRLMAVASDGPLRKVAAWPQRTLHKSRGGPVVGFIMSKVSGRQALHRLYSPAHRKQEHPELRWDFLVYAARNLAAAFDTLHRKGIVLGDVNQGNATVDTKTSHVTLIDCDSFQLNPQYLCEVGVSHFTPPELQGVGNFASVVRTPNHDNFGLALLVFHLLFAGRHPFSGVPTGKGDLPLEKAIKEFRFAYSRTAPKRGIGAPPLSLSLALVPDALPQMFEFAFTEPGTRPIGRPTAQMWVDSLDRLGRALRQCATSKAHVFSTHVATCPWCSLEARGAVLFFDVTAYVAGPPAAPGAPFNLAQVWAAITAVVPPATWRAPDPAQFTAAGAPTPVEVRRGHAKAMAVKVVVTLAALALIIAVPGAWFLSAIAVGVTLFSSGNAALERERTRRQHELAQAQLAFSSAKDAAERSHGAEAFNNKLLELQAVRSRYVVLPREEQEAVRKLQASAEKRQREAYLDRYFIDAAVISGIGPARKAALASFGIETAADVSLQRILGIRGFGESLAGALVDWRNGIERKFRFDPAKAVTPADLAQLRATVWANRQAMENELLAGVEALRRIVHESATKRASAEQTLRVLAQAVAQARADLTALAS